MSGEADFNDKEITSGEIIDSIDIETIEDPYNNFWLSLTEILNDCFTESNRELKIKIRTKEMTFKIDDIGWNPQEPLKTILTLTSSTAICIALIKWVTIISEKIQSGSMDKVLEANEEGICSLF